MGKASRGFSHIGVLVSLLGAGCAPSVSPSVGSGSTSASASSSSGTTGLGLCGPCSTNSQCQSGYCDRRDGTCNVQNPCATTADCGGTLACDTGTGNCVCPELGGLCAACTRSDQCLSGYCDRLLGACNLANPCASASDCGSLGCDLATGNCVCGSTSGASSSGSGSASSSETSSSSGTGGSGVETGPIVVVAASPPAAMLTVGATLVLAAAATDAAGQPAGTVPTLFSSAPGVASLSGDTVTGQSAGTAFIQYLTAAGPISVSTITVVASSGSLDGNAPASISAGPSPLSVQLQGSRQLQAQAFTLSGAPFSAALDYGSANPEVAAVDAQGLVTGVAPGLTTITVYLPATEAAPADAGIPASALAQVAAQVVVEVLTADAGEPLPEAGGCPVLPDGGRPPVPVSCRFQHSPYQVMVGHASQLEPVEVTYACPLSTGFSSAGHYSGWSENLPWVDPDVPITAAGVISPSECDRAYGVNFQPAGASFFCPQPAILYTQPDFTGEFTCQTGLIHVDGGVVEFTGAPVDTRTICPLSGDPNCCAFQETNVEEVNAVPQPATCSSQAQTVALGGRVVPLLGFACTLGPYVPNSTCTTGWTFDCDAGPPQIPDAGPLVCCVATSICSTNDVCNCFYEGEQPSGVTCSDILSGVTLVPSCSSLGCCGLTPGSASEIASGVLSFCNCVEASELGPCLSGTCEMATGTPTASCP